LNAKCGGRAEAASWSAKIPHFLVLGDKPLNIVSSEEGKEGGVIIFCKFNLLPPAGDGLLASYDQERTKRKGA
jgi:hypothetical protein